MKRLLPLVFSGLAIVGCQPAKPPVTPLPTKQNSVDKVTTEIDAAQKQAMERLREAEEKAESESPMKKGY